MLTQHVWLCLAWVVGVGRGGNKSNTCCASLCAGCQDNQCLADHIWFQHGRHEGRRAGSARGAGLPVEQRSHDALAALHRHRPLGLRVQQALFGGQKQTSKLVQQTSPLLLCVQQALLGEQKQTSRLVQQTSPLRLCVQQALFGGQKHTSKLVHQTSPLGLCVQQVLFGRNMNTFIATKIASGAVCTTGAFGKKYECVYSNKHCPV